MHGVLPDEAEAILGLFDEWGEVNRSHRKLAYRGSYLHRAWVFALQRAPGAFPCR